MFSLRLASFSVIKFLLFGMLTSIISANTIQPLITASDGSHWIGNIVLGCTNYAGADQYKIYRYDSLSDTTGTLVYDNPQGCGMVFDPNIIAEKTYYYELMVCSRSTCYYSPKDSGYALKGTPIPPSNLTATQGEFSDKIKLTWSKADLHHATSYKIFRSLSSDIKQYGSKIYETEDRYVETFIDTNVETGTIYYYHIQSCIGGSCSGFVETAPGWVQGTIVPPPTHFDASKGAYDNLVELDWSQVGSAHYYKIFRSDSQEKTGTLLLKTTDNTQIHFSDTTVTPGKTYFYRIQSCITNACSSFAPVQSGFAYYNTADTPQNSIAASLEHRTFAIAYFFHFGDDAFDWMYVQPGGAIVAKLEGMNSSGYLQWKVFQNAKSTSFTSVDTYTIQLDNTVSTSVVFGNYIGTDTKTHDIGLLLSGKTENVDGYFARYGVGAYDWIYVSADRKMIAKLEGIDPATNYFIWTMLQQGSTKLFTSVDIIDGGEKIEFGSLKK